MISIKRFWFCIVFIALCSVCSATTVPYKDNSKPKYESLTPFVKHINIGYETNTFSPLVKDSFDIKPVVYNESHKDKIAERFGKLMKAIMKWGIFYAFTIVVILTVITLLGGMSMAIVYFQHEYMKRKENK
jgi:hypothetical protein